ncbi:MBL fold metallo-hydrolase [Moritella sp. F3]|uniref:MBL fold metallo-hydrolase n=1 Tax=Moritella sp. F3 TaxID=2718882 RepID=UPI001A1A6F03|nr:MBL fold metallo-hydrolase [Moritella sp. F3]GIC79538.1 MBL fold metallo-hydrolase [Moritella sp. F1]GIC80072.1 MBL fold metallo-hydrolase [Moritella sp. F3]
MSLQATIIDSALDYESNSGNITFDFAHTQIEFIKQHNLTLVWILETHAHADHLSAAHYLRSQLGGKIAIGKYIIQAQQTFKDIFALSDTEISVSGKEFDQLLSHNDTLFIGDTAIKVIETPGHTKDSVTYLIEDNAFIGDTLFMPDSGSARCDFPGGAASELYQSVKRLYALADHTKLWMCHDYQPNGRQLQFQTTVAESKLSNIHITKDVSLDHFVSIRQTRDSKLAVPRLLYPALQVNIKAGELPQADEHQPAFFKIPVHILRHIVQTEDVK